MIKIAICDDMKYGVAELRELVERYEWKEKYRIDTFLTRKDLTDSVENGNDYDILFMDVEFWEDGEKKKGTETAAYIKSKYPKTLVIYASNYDDYYIDIAQAEPFKFLHKPVNKEQMDETLTAALARIHDVEKIITEKQIPKYQIQYNRGAYILNLNNISYIYSARRKVYFHENTGEEICCYKKLDKVEQEINKISNEFVRVNKSYIVNMRSLTKKTSKMVKIGEIEITVSRECRDSYTNKMLSWLEKR